MLWKWLYIDGCKPHTVPLSLEADLIADLTSREELRGQEPPAVESKEVVKLCIDLPGMCAVDRPWMEFRIDGLVIEMPCEDVTAFYMKLQTLKPRHFKSPYQPGQEIHPGVVATGGPEEGLTYYKLHGFTQCLVLTPDLYVDLLDALKVGLVEAETRSVTFWADRKLPSEVLREAAALSTGRPIEEIPDLGGHKQDRFKPKKGKA